MLRLCQYEAYEIINVNKVFCKIMAQDIQCKRLERAKFPNELMPTAVHNKSWNKNEV